MGRVTPLDKHTVIEIEEPDKAHFGSAKDKLFRQATINDLVSC